jgi:hypothetical protein
MPVILAICSSAASVKTRQRRRVGETCSFSTPALDAKVAKLVPQLPAGALQLQGGLVVALALVRDVVRSPRASNLSSLEHRLLRDMYLQQGVTLSYLMWTAVIDIAVLESLWPHQVSHGYLAGPWRTLFHIPGHRAQALRFRQVRHHGVLRSSEQVLAEWALVQHCTIPLDDIWALSLPSPMVHLVAHSYWSVLVMYEKHFSASKRAFQYLRAHTENEAPPDADSSLADQTSSHQVFDHRKFRAAAALLRSSDADLHGFSADEIVSWLDEVGDMAEQGFSTLMNYASKGGRGGNSYKSEALIEAVLIADLLRDSGGLREVLERGMRLVLGPCSGLLDKGVLSAASSLPSKTLISRYRLSLDVAYMRLLSNHFKTLLDDAAAGGDGFSVYFLADASARGGRSSSSRRSSSSSSSSSSTSTSSRSNSR